MKIDEIEIGHDYAYRVGGQGAFTRVKCLEIQKRSSPPRVVVRFEADGVKDRVTPARLHVEWDLRDALMEKESRQAAVRKASLGYNDPREDACHVVFDELIDRTIASAGHSKEAGVITISDVDALARILEIEPTQLESDSLTFRDGDDLVAPWATTSLVLTRLCELNSEKILKRVESDERAAAARIREHGSDDPWWSGFEENQVQARNILRQWCGTEAVERRDELIVLREQVKHAWDAAESAIKLLRNYGYDTDADRLSRELHS
ncbi:hypothetical protein G8767_30120 [Rhodococcus sp. IC4_135]|uniref:hypothetical protein n=1 Tax=Rhodococcus sp. IC4_135 TaxID=2715537 RepID=UPI00142387A3|nr:hypothetical protein [Rhodococcus sp. IC4_135]